jgi:hypothetical protein
MSSSFNAGLTVLRHQSQSPAYAGGTCSTGYTQTELGRQVRRRLI